MAGCEASQEQPIQPEKAISSEKKESKDETISDIKRLEALGYINGVEEPGEKFDVLVHNKEQVQQGYTFFTSGGKPEGYLMDLDGNIKHTWRLSFMDVGWEYRKVGPSKNYWRHARPLPNGDVLIIFEGFGLVRIDRDSNVLWFQANKAHHDFFIKENGDIVVLTRKAHVVSRISERAILEDFITTISPEGKELSSISVLEMVENTPNLRELLLKPQEYDGDLFHTNTVEIFDGTQAKKSKFFAAGNILTSFRNKHTVAILDIKNKSVVWSQTGKWVGQHSPELIDDGSLVVFDNNTPINTKNRHAGSRIVIYDLQNDTIKQEFKTDPARDFYTGSCGKVEELHNGNFLITESEAGRLFELSPDFKTVVWEYILDHKTTDGKQAFIHDATRVDKKEADAWLKGK